MLKAPPVPSQQEEHEAASAVHAESWYLDINKKELRWESYVKAGYFVRPLTSSLYTIIAPYDPRVP